MGRTKATYEELEDAVNAVWVPLGLAVDDETWAKVLEVVVARGWTEGEYLDESAWRYDAELAAAFE